MYYFAYGSNLSSPRLTNRVPSAVILATGQLRRHRLRFHKIGRDGSAKCNALYTGLSGDRVLGAVFRINPADRRLLDQAEGLALGYESKEVLIVTPGGERIEAFTYYATRIDPGNRPFHWYKEHVLRGLREHGFSGDYLRAVEEIASVEDLDDRRSALELDIYHAEGS